MRTDGYAWSRPGLRTIRIPAPDVRKGMRVVALDRSWLGTPFLLQGFEVTQERELELLCEWCTEVEVQVPEDFKRPSSLTRSGQRAPQRIERRHHYADTRPAAEEFETAGPIFRRGLAQARSLHTAVAAGKPLDLNAVRGTVADCVNSVVRNPAPLRLLSQLRNRDEYTAEHSLNVALLAISFGRHLGLAESDLHSVGTAAILHDIGKMRTPLEILNKPGRLEPDEAEIMRDHARQGYEILTDTQGVPPLAMEVAHCHHEAPDGSGYPRQLRADSLSDFNSIVTLCDVYDAITSERIYKPGRSSVDALKVIHGLRGSKFHEGLATEFIRHISLYPIGSIVELRTGEVAIVIGHTTHRHLPKVLIVRDADKQVMEPRLTHLDKAAASISQARLIKRVLPNGSYSVQIAEFMPELVTGI